MQTAMARPRSETGGAPPAWFHHHGRKMKLVALNEGAGQLIIRGSAAQVIVKRGRDFQEGGNGWVVQWRVTQSAAYAEEVHGQRHFTNADLAAAFDVVDDVDVYAEERGVYSRWKEFLNIPCPGTGHDGDPNVSIYVTDEIRDAVRCLLRGYVA